MYDGKASVFDALTVHLDEVETLAPGSTVLATNAQSAVQAVEIKRGELFPLGQYEKSVSPAGSLVRIGHKLGARVQHLSRSFRGRRIVGGNPATLLQE